VTIEHNIAFHSFAIAHPASVVEFNGRTLRAGAMNINGQRVKGGTYSGATLPPNVTDGSLGESGLLVVGNNETIVITR